MNPRDLVLHAAAIKRHAPAPAIAALAGLTGEDAQRELDDLVATGRAVSVQGGASSDAYALTPLAGVALRARYGLHFGALREAPDFVAAYEAFERINVTLKQTITDWQTMDLGGMRIANDHSNKAHDAAVIDRLGALHEKAEPILAALAAALPRLAYYGEKLLAALEAAEDGGHEWVSDVRRDSYHTVWFELHEDLLRIMGREREE